MHMEVTLSLLNNVHIWHTGLREQVQCRTKMHIALWSSINMPYVRIWWPIMDFMAHSYCIPSVGILWLIHISSILWIVHMHLHVFDGLLCILWLFHSSTYVLFLCMCPVSVWLNVDLCIQFVIPQHHPLNDSRLWFGTGSPRGGDQWWFR